MLGIGLGQFGPYIDTSASIQAAERALANLRPDGQEKIREYVSGIFRVWKFDHGRPVPRLKGLLSMFEEPDGELDAGCEAER